MFIMNLIFQLRERGYLIMRGKIVTAASSVLEVSTWATIEATCTGAGDTSSSSSNISKDSIGNGLKLCDLCVHTPTTCAWLGDCGWLRVQGRKKITLSQSFPILPYHPLMYLLLYPCFKWNPTTCLRAAIPMRPTQTSSTN